MITQYGVLAYDLTEDGAPRFMLITSRSTKRWVVPRGNPIKGLTPYESAAQEAYEEAGLAGYISPEEIGAYRYGKRRRNNSVQPAEVHVFPLYVTAQSRHFPERHQRETRWFTREAAVEVVEEESLRSLIAAFQPPAEPATGILMQARTIAPPFWGRQSAVLTAVLALLAAVWAAMALTGGTGSSYDPPLLAWFYANDNLTLAVAARVVTQLGGWILLSLFSAAFALWLFFKGERRNALCFLAIVVSGRLLVDAQKILSARGRPEQDHLVIVQSLSFPSGHSANSVVTYMTMALLLAPLLKTDWSRRALFVAAALLCLAIGFSRMILGVHWPSDVLGGWSFGLFWTFALARFAERSGTPSRDLHRSGPKETVKESN